MPHFAGVLAGLVIIIAGLILVWETINMILESSWYKEKLRKRIEKNNKL